MANTDAHIEVLLTPAQRKRIEQAAALAGASVSSFIVRAALDRADALAAKQASTVVPAAYFDQLVASLDEPADAPRLASAAREATKRGWIKSA